MGGSAVPTGVQTQQQNLLGAPSVLDTIRSTLIGPQTPAPATPATPEKEATKASGAQLDRRRRTSVSGRLTAPRKLQRRTLLGE